MTTPIKTNNDSQPMTYIQYGWEKCKRQPLVPLGAAATTVALLGATASLRSGNRRSFQRFLRLRVAAQGLTVLAMVIGAYTLTNKAESIRESRERVLTGNVPPDKLEPFPDAEQTSADTAYPPRIKTKVSDFTRRLREAEELQREDEVRRR